MLNYQRFRGFFKRLNNLWIVYAFCVPSVKQWNNATQHLTDLEKRYRRRVESMNSVAGKAKWQK